MKKSCRYGFIIGAAVAILHASIDLSAAAEAKRLGPIVEALRARGRNFFMAQELAEVLGIPVETGEEGVITKGQVFETDGMIRAAQTPADDRLDYAIFMVQRDSDVWFYVADSAGSLKKLLRRDRAKKENANLDPKSGESAFRAEIAYWERELKVGDR